MYKAPRGTQDTLPQDQHYWRFVEEKAAEICRLYSYERIDTPVFEQTSLFSRSVGEGTDIVQKQMYTFEDRGGDSMTLRPEGTAPVCRAYIEHGMHNLPQPVRLYYVTPIFRYERPQKGRVRQHHQFGVEAIGEAAPALDAEVISLAWTFYDKLGLKELTLQLNSLGCRVCRPQYLVTLKAFYTAHHETICADCRSRLPRNPLRLLDCKKPSCQEIAKDAPRIPEHLCAGCGSHFDALRDHLGDLQIPYEFNPYLVRGLDYYTRTVFEIQPPELGAQSALGGGGRYDDLIDQLGGKPTPAVGFATGIERIILNLHQQGVPVPASRGDAVRVAYVGAETKKEAIKLAGRLRSAGISATNTSADGVSLKSQLRQANSLDVRHTLIIGEDEWQKGYVTWRDMISGEQRQIKRDEVVERLKEDLIKE